MSDFNNHTTSVRDNSSSHRNKHGAERHVRNNHYANNHNQGKTEAVG